jgi:ribonuclease VapC
MSDVILDASALLAVINEEQGAEIVTEHIPRVIMSTINVSECATILCNTGLSEQQSQLIISDLVSKAIDFNIEQAWLAARFYKETKKYGLSLGDRACLSLAKILKLPVLTADKAWAKLKLGIDIILIR